MNQFRTISHADAQELIATDGAVVLVVRTPGEHDDLGHIPGSWLLPLDLVVSAAAVLPDDGRPVLVYCEHGVRSVAASRLLSQAGVTEVLNLAGGMASWTGAREFGATPMRGPAAWLIETHTDALHDDVMVALDDHGFDVVRVRGHVDSDRFRVIYASRRSDG